MPSADTGDFSETSVRFSWQPRDAPPRDDALSTPALCDSNGITHIVLVEDVRDWDLVFKLSFAECNLIDNVSPVHLDFHDVGFLLPKVLQLVNHLSVANQTDDVCVVLDALFSSALVFLMLESAVLVAPPLEVSALEFLLQRGSPHCSDGFQSPHRLLITYKAHSNHRGRFQNGYTLYDFFLVGLRSRPRQFSKHVCHTSFVANEGGEMTVPRSRVFREGFDFSTMTAGAFSWKKR